MKKVYCIILYKVAVVFLSLCLFDVVSISAHSENIDLSKMKLIHSSSSLEHQSTFRLFIDLINGDYYGEFGQFNSNTLDTDIDINVVIPPTKIVANIKVEMAARREGFIYSYTFMNERYAQQGIHRMEFDGIYRINPDHAIGAGTLNVVDPPQPENGILILDIQSPPDWIASRRVSEDPFFGWFNGSGGHVGDIAPNQSKSGFIIESPYLPGIRRVGLQGALSSEDESRSGFPEMYDDEEAVVRELVWNDTNNYIYTHTICPVTKPPQTMIVECDTFILDLIGQVREAAALGWIKHDLRKDDDNRRKGKGDDKGVKKGQDDDRRDGWNPAKSTDGRDRDDGDDHADDDVEMDDADKNLPGAVPSEIRDILSRSGDDALPGIAKSIIQKLTKVRRECLRGKFGRAREKLRALIKQVKAQRGEHLTDEAYYLIRFNAEFLLEKL